MRAKRVVACSRGPRYGELCISESARDSSTSFTHLVEQFTNQAWRWKGKQCGRVETECWLYELSTWTSSMAPCQTHVRP